MAAYIFQECGKELKSKSGLRRRMANHVRQGNYYCCGKVFQDTYHLRRHRASKHEGPKNYVCTNCGKAFAASYLLAAHEETERKTKYVACDICEAKCRDEVALREHKTSHTNVKCHFCRTCGKSYKQKSSLSRRKKVHERND